MLRVARQAKILQMINDRGFVENEELAKTFSVTQTTIRRDLKTLVEQKLIKLDHGGSYNLDLLDSSVEPLYETKVYFNHEKERAVGAKAASFVQDGDSIFLDSGTTIAEVAHQLKHSQLKNLTVITCDLMVAKDLGSEPNINVVMLGGMLRKSYYSVYGPYTEYVLKNITATKVFLGIDAANINSGIFNTVLEEVPTKQLMIRNSDEVFVVSDSSKFGKKALYKVCSWDEIDHIVTDHNISQEYLDFFKQRNINEIVVPESIPSREDD